MSVWDYWDNIEAEKTNLRLLIPGKGWVAYTNQNDNGNVVEHGSKEEIDSALINALSATNFLSLVGAGASLCARNSEKKLQAPKMSDLWNTVKEAIGEAEFSAVCDKFPNAQLNNSNIEKLLSLCKIYLELYETETDGKQDVTQVRTFVQKAEATILSRVDFVDHETLLSAHEAYIKKVGRRGFRKTRAKLFTTNYDLTFEEAARRLRFTIIDGFSHSLDQVYDRQYYELDIVRREVTKEAPDYIPNVFQLYKLHGSVDWRRIGTEVVRSRDSKDGKPVLIYPRSSKYQEAFEPPYLDMMGTFQSALREPDTALLIAGFGFNDDHISSPIISALESNLSLRLIICDPIFISSEADVCMLKGEIPPHQIALSSDHSNRFLKKILKLVEGGDPRIHLINGRFEDLTNALPDLIGQTDRERHFERIKIFRDWEA